ncbi:MAG TPA: hypothetical protein VFF79_13040 [Conexibacter sp.]|jgi:hypothetical protein|nr:hypothetical protein [Conexibacter sp.]
MSAVHDKTLKELDDTMAQLDRANEVIDGLRSELADIRAVLSSDLRDAEPLCWAVDRLVTQRRSLLALVAASQQDGDGPAQETGR